MRDVEEIRRDFPILDRKVHGKPLIYLDNAATTQVPSQVIERIAHHYQSDNGNVHRGIHFLSEQSTTRMEDARRIVQHFIHAGSTEEIVFSQGTTDSIHLVAEGLRATLKEGDEVVVSQLEHHSNFVPWQQLCLATGAKFRVVPTPDGELDMKAFRATLGKRTRLLAMTHVSNLTGTVMPLEEVITAAHDAGAQVLIDGAQAIRHELVDVQKLGCDFYCFSGHKALGPTGIGVLYGKRAGLEALAPARFGGGMVETVKNEATTFASLPFRLEAGTPNYVGAIAMGEALRYLENIGRAWISEREKELLAYAEDALTQFEGLTILGNPARRAGAISFVMEGIHPYDLASLLDKFGIAVRTGHHCAQPALRSFGLESVTRVSPAFYNTFAEIDGFCSGMRNAISFLRKWTKANDDSGARAVCHP